MSVRIGIMQGRLLPAVNNRIQAFPKSNWEKEFPLAERLGFDTIEFIFDDDEDEVEHHPLLANDCQPIKALIARHSVDVQTICVDYCMKHPLHREDERDIARSLDFLRRLLDGAQSLGVTDIVIPCVDQSSLRTQADQERLIQNLKPILHLCEAKKINFALETDLGPIDLKSLLDKLQSSCIRVNYDVGNSAAFGYDPVEEWEAYGELVSSVHIKDRVLGGPSVPLGTGAVRFDVFFRIARNKGYQGPFIIQAARYVGKDDLIVVRQYKEFIQSFIARYY